MDLTKTNFTNMREDILAALAAVGNKYGCDVTVGKIKYDDININVSVDFTARGEDGESGEQVAFNRDCVAYGFEPEHYNKRFVMENKIFRLIGFNPKARKYHCIIVDDNGKKYTANTEAVKECLVGTK